MTIEEIIISFSYFAIILLMTSNGVTGFPSSQIIYIISGWFAYQGSLFLLPIILIGALGHTIGNLIQYELAKRKGLEYSVKFIKYLFPLNDPILEVKKVIIAFKKKSILLLIIGKLVNPLKIFISIPAGISKMNIFIFLPIVYITSAIWAIIFTLIGYYFGKSYSNFGYVGVIAFLIFIGVSFYFYKYMNSEEILKEIKTKKN